MISKDTCQLDTMIFWLERNSLGFPGPRACSTWMDSLLACGASGPHLRHMRPAQSKLAQVENFHGGLDTPSLIILILFFEQSDDDPEVALKSSFWDGVREGGGGSVPHCCKEKEFDLARGVPEAVPQVPHQASQWPPC